MLVNFGQNTFLIAIYPLLYLIDYLLYKIKSNVRWFRRARRTLRANLYWNLLFRSAFEFSLILMIILTLDIAVCNFTEFSFGFSFVISATLLVLLTAVPLFIRFYILKKYNLLRTNYMMRRYSDIFEGLQLKNNPKSLIIMEYFMYRRLIYGLCMVLLEGKLYLQFMILLQSSMLNLGIMLYYDVYEKKRTAFIESINELSLIVLIYHCMYFTDFVDDANTRYLVGLSCCAVTIVNIAFNIFMCAAFSTT